LVSETCSRAHNNRGQNFYRQNLLIEAEREMRLALAQRRARFGNDHLTVAVSMSTLGNVLERAGRVEEAMTLQRDALACFERIGMADTGEYAQIQNSLAQSQHLAKDHLAALATIEHALTLWRRKMPDGKSRELSMLVLKIRILTALERRDAAREVAEAAIALKIDPARIPPREKDYLRAASGRSDLFP
jgi:tetratricopeptide (TPR) repeat protein